MKVRSGNLKLRKRIRHVRGSCLANQCIDWLFHNQSQQLAHLCKLMRELNNEKANRCHEETSSFRVASSTSSSGSRSDNGIPECTVLNSTEKLMHMLSSSHSKRNISLIC